MKSIKEIKDALKSAAERLENASERLDQVERDGKDLEELKGQAEELVSQIEYAIGDNESNVDEVRSIKAELEDTYLTISALVQEMEAQENIVMKEVTFQVLADRSTGGITFRLLDPSGVALGPVAVAATLPADTGAPATPVA